MMGDDLFPHPPYLVDGRQKLLHHHTKHLHRPDQIEGPPPSVTCATPSVDLILSTVFANLETSS